MPISIDISDNYIKILEGEQQGSKIKIHKAILKPIDMYYINNGYIVNKIDLTLFLTDIVNEYKLKNKECFVTINSTDTVTKEIMLPKTKIKHLQKLIKNSIKELFGDTVNLCIDYQICEELKKEDKTFYKIFIYAIPFKIVNDLKSVISNAGLLPKCLDIKRNAISKILEYKINNNDIKKYISLFIEISGKNMILNLMYGNITLYKRDIDISEEIKREELFLNRENKESIKEEEDSILGEVALTVVKNDDEITFLDDEQDYFQEEASFISPILLRIYEEINKIIQFAMSLNNGNIEKIYLYGDRENLEEIVEYVFNNIMIETEKITEISNIKYNEDIDIAKFFNTIGNILRK